MNRLCKRASRTLQLAQRDLVVAAGILCSAAIVFAQPAVTIQPPNLTGATAGSLAGGAGVSPTGASTYTIPIAVPPGTAGLAPSLTLNYSSQSARGLLGYGWSIGGLSAITRCPQTFVPDGVRGAVTLTSTDQFCVDGQRLRLVSGTHGATAEYRTQIDTISKYTSTGGDTSKGPDSWTVYAKGGLILTYGGTTDATINAGGKTPVTTLTWALSRVQDRRGNYYDIKYTQIDLPVAGTLRTIEYFPTQIRYTGNIGTGLAPYNAINFVYETRPDPWTGYVANTGLSATQRLTALRTVVNTAADGSGGTLVRDYRVGYTTNPINGRSLVNTVTDCDGAGNCLSPTTFAWSTWNTAANTFVAPGSGDWGGMPVALQSPNATIGTQDQQVHSQVLVGDVNGDGAMDLISSDGSGVWKVCLGGASAFTCQNWSGPAVLSTQAIYGDFNGDGRMDIATASPAGDGTWTVCLSTGTDFSCSPWATQTVGGSPNWVLVGDFDGDGRDDIIVIDRYNLHGGSKLCKSLGNAFAPCIPYDMTDFITDTQTDPEIGPRVTSRMMGDFNGDGRTDVMIGMHDGALRWLQTYIASDTGLRAGSAVQGMVTYGAGSTLTTDLNGDPYGAYSDVMPQNSTQTATSVCRSTGPSFVCDPLLGSDSTSQVWQVSDADGDGRPDLFMNGKVCQIGQSAPFQMGATYGSIVNGNSVNVTCAVWQSAYGGPNAITSYSGDFDGDGHVDGVFYIGTTNSWVVHLSGNGGFPDLLASVVDGLGHETQFTYKGTNDASVYTRGADVAYPKRNVPGGASAVVSQRRDANALGGWLNTDYSYQGQRTDLRGLGPLGFEKVTSVDETNGTTTLTTLSQDFPYIGRPTQVKVTQANGVILSQSDFTLASFATAGGATFPYVSDSSLVAKNLDNTSLPSVATHIASSGIDAYGNVTSVTQTTTSPDGDVFTTATTNTYDNLTANWLIGLLRRTSIAKTAQQATGGAPTSSTLTLTGCTSTSPVNVPATATMSCTLRNNGQSVASSISYSAPAGTTVSGPTNCAANTSCGTVTVTASAAATYSGTLTATPTPSGGAGSAAVSLVVNAPSVAFLPVSTNWGTVGAASDSGDTPLIKNNSTVPILITAHTTVSGPPGMWSYQGGNCIPGTTVLQPGTYCSTFFGTGNLATPGAYSATDQISFQVVSGSGATYTVQQAYTFSVGTTTANSSGLAFGNVAVNTTGTAQSFTLTNNALNGSSLKNLSISVIGSQPANFPMTNTCGTTLAQGASCTVTVSFNPTWVANGFSASVQVQGGYSRMQSGADSGYTPLTGVNFTVPLAGNGAATIATLTSASTLAVPVAWYGQTAQAVTATYRNDGLVPLSLNSPALSAPLSVTSNNCAGIAPGASCSIVILATTNVPGINQSQSFTPSGAYTAPAATTVTWTTQTAVPRWSPTSLSFGQVGYGLSQSQNITLYNDGNVAYNWAANSTIANPPAGYSFNTSACSSVAPAGGSCNVVVTFAPPGAATYSGGGISMSSISYNTNTFSVTGIGYFVPRITSSPTSVTATTTGSAAATATVAFSNAVATVTTLSVSVSGAGLSLSGTSLTCAAPGPCGSVTVSSPAVAGTYSGTITAVSSPPATAPTTVPVTFTVNAAPANTTLTASPTSLAFGTVTKGVVTAVQSTTITNTGAASAVINLSQISTAGNSGIGSYTTSGTCVSGGPLAAGSSCTVGVRYTAACVAGARYVTLSIQGSNFTTVSVPLTATTGTATSPSCS